MNTLPSNNLIDKSQKSLWGHGNNFLYELCKNNFEHKKGDVIVTKTLFIGRIYAVALERSNKKKEKDITTFYFKSITGAFQNSKLDIRLKELKKVDKLTPEIIPMVLETHNYLMETLNKITGHNNRSFCSKYLHFHLPNLFFIYDSIASSNLSKYRSRISNDLKNILMLKNIDLVYANYFCKCFDLQSDINNKYKRVLTIRQLDNLLLETNL